MIRNYNILAPFKNKAGFSFDILQRTMVLNLGLVLEKLSGFYNSNIRICTRVPGSTDLSVSTDRKSTDLASKGHQFC